MSEKKIILGIDPGSLITGYAIMDGTSSENLKILTLGVIKAKKFTDFELRLCAIQQGLERLFSAYFPNVLAVEDPFFGKNPQSMLKLGQVQGIIFSETIRRDIPFFRYSPKTVKQTITGNGNASKEQLFKMLEIRFKKKIDFETLDATDALGVAYCHLLEPHTKGRKKKTQGWSTFVSQNPQRIIRRK